MRWWSGFRACLPRPRTFAGAAVSPADCRKPHHAAQGVFGDARGSCRGRVRHFGLAKSDVLKLAEGNSGPELAGTAAYLAPEQARDASWVDLRADIYSLGVTLYEVLTGKLPFEGRNRMQMIFQHMNTAAPSASATNPEVPMLASDLCQWMLAKNPDERPQTFEDVRQGFDTVMSSLAKR